MPKNNRCLARRRLPIDSHAIRAFNCYSVPNINHMRWPMNIDMPATSSDKSTQAPGHTENGGNDLAHQNSNSNLRSKQQPANLNNPVRSQPKTVFGSNPQVFSRADAAAIFRTNTRNNGASSDDDGEKESELPLVHSTFEHSVPPLVTGGPPQVVQGARKPKLPRFRSRDRKRKPAAIMTALHGQRIAKRKRVNSVPYFKPLKMASIVESCLPFQNRGSSQSHTDSRESTGNMNGNKVENAPLSTNRSSNDGGKQTEDHQTNVTTTPSAAGQTKSLSKERNDQNIMTTRSRAAQREGRLPKRIVSNGEDDLTASVQNISINEHTNSDEVTPVPTQPTLALYASLTNLCRDDRLKRKVPDLSQNRVRILERQVASKLNEMRKARNAPQVSLSAGLCKAGKVLCEYLSGTGALEGNIAPFQYYSYTFMSSPNDAVHENAKKLEQYWKNSQAVVDALCDCSLAEIGVAVSGSGRSIFVTIVKNGKC